jgi:hypothetical protein
MTLSTLLNPVEAVFILRRGGGGWGGGGLTVGGGGSQFHFIVLLNFAYIQCHHSSTRDVIVQQPQPRNDKVSPFHNDK